MESRESLAANDFEGLPILPEVNEPPYDRDLYKHWIDADAAQPFLSGASTLLIGYRSKRSGAWLWIQRKWTPLRKGGRFARSTNQVMR